MEKEKLPYRQGSFCYSKRRIQIKKQIELPDGTKIRKTVTSDTVRECMSTMSQLEKKIIKQTKLEKNELLCEAMNKWLKNVKAQTLKTQSYNRLNSTIKIK